MRWSSCLFIGGIGVHEDLRRTPEERTARSRGAVSAQRATVTLTAQSTTSSAERGLNCWSRRRCLCQMIAVLLQEIDAIAQRHHIAYEARDGGSGRALFAGEVEASSSGFPGGLCCLGHRIRCFRGVGVVENIIPTPPASAQWFPAKLTIADGAPF